jgi:hypothetical protein
MTAPRHLRSLDPSDVRLGERMSRSWVPHERSRLLSMPLWEHERWIEPDGDGAWVARDRLTCEPRGPLPRGLVARIVRALLRHRHLRLWRRFGGAAAT